MQGVEVLALQEFVREVQFASENSLQALANEEHTSQFLSAELVRARSLSSGARRLITLLKANAPSGKTDGGDLVPAFENARDTVWAMYNLICADSRQVANGPAMTSDAGAMYAELVAETAALHNKLNELAWLVGEHAADADEKLPGTFSSAKELLQAMGG